MELIKSIVKFILTIFLAIFYAIYVLPASLFVKFGKDKFVFQKRPGGSYFIDRNHTFKPEDFEKM